MTALELIKKDLERHGKLKNYVILKKDDKGYYIEYAFTEGVPHDNRCLSWYDSYQEKAYIRNKWLDGLTEEEGKKRLARIKEERESKVGKLFRLGSFTCGYEEYEEETLQKSKERWKKYNENTPFIPEEHICKVGHPAKACEWCKKTWTYEEPVKCACWSLEKQSTMEEFINNYHISMPATELAKIL